MAKKKVFIDVVIDDKGTTKRVAVDAKKLGKNLDETAISARTADRNIKGAAQASSNATKNFSKMAQGTGGLVAAYATLAANIFAISAAYNFLKKAGDMRVMQEGQELFASRTGTSLEIMTRQLQGATDGLLKYADAAQGAAIGTAAGLSGQQLQGLATAASNVSKALGRDLTDSYNRLIRGATKAEPELLDELGIILRLDTAAGKYAATLGKTASELTSFERTQAVTNEILEQATDKFEDFEGIDVSGIERLAKAFDDVVRNIMKVLEPLSSFIGNVMADNVTALGAAFAGLGVGIVRSITPAMPTLAGVDTSTQGIAQRMAKFDVGGATGSRIAAAAAGEGKLTEQDVKRFENAIGKKKSTLLDFEKTNQNEARKTAQVAKLALLDQTRANQTGIAKLKTGWKIYWGTLIAEHGRTMGIMQGMTMGFTSIVGKVLGAAGYVGIIVSAGIALKGVYDKLNYSEERLKKRRAIKTINEDLEKNIEILYDTRGALFDTGNGFDNLSLRMANVVQADFGTTIKKLGRIKKITKEMTDGLIQYNSLTDRALQEAGASQNRFIAGVKKFFAAAAAGTASKAGLGTKEESYALGMKPEDFAALQEQIKGYIPVLQAMQTEEEYNLDLLAKGSPLRAAQIERIEQIKGALERAEKQYKNTTKGVEELDGVIPSLNLTLFNLGNTKSEVVKEAEALTQALQQIKFGAKGFVDSLNKLGQFKTPFTGIIDQLKDMQNGLDRAMKASDEFKGDFSKDFKGSEIEGVLKDAFGEDFINVDSWTQVQDKLKNVLGFYKKLSELAATEKTHVQTRFQLMKTGTTPLVKAELAAQEKIQLKRAEIRAVEREIFAQLDKNDSLTEEQTQKYEAQLGLLNAQLQTMEYMNDETNKLGMALKDGFESSFQTNLAALLKDEKSSIKDAMVSIAQGMLGSLADQLSENLTKRLSMTLFGNKEEAAAEKNAARIRKAHVDGIVAGFKQAKADGALQASDITGDNQGITPLSADKLSDSSSTSSKVAKSGLSVEDAWQQSLVRAEVETDKDGNAISGPGGKGKLAQAGKKGPLGTLFTDFTRDFGAIFEKNTSGGLLGKLGTLFTNFGSNFMDIFSGLLGSFGKGGAGGSGILGLVSTGMSLFGFANGGIVKGGFRKYANGGIAKSPHIGVIGEGKYNEAVVPLPDGRSIPVQGTGMGATNNTTVNVTVDSKGGAQTTTESDSQMGDQLGKLIAKAVQEELHYQQRSGGILNPYGAA